MASRTMNVLLNLKDMYTAKMNGATMATKQQSDRLKILKKDLRGIGADFKGFTGSMLKSGLGLMGISTAISGIASTLSEAMGNYAVQAKAEAGVDTALNRQMQGADTAQIEAMSASYKDLASNLQQVGVIGDEVTLSGMSMLTNMGVQADQVKSLTPVIQDLAVKNYGVSVSVEQFADMNKTLGKAINTGSMKALNGLGVAVTEEEQKLFKSMNTTQRAEFLQQKLTKAVGGTNKAMANTTAGKQQQALNNYGDALEALGKPLYELKGKIQGALIKPMGWLANSIPYAVTWIENLTHAVGDIFSPVLDALGLDESATEWESWADTLSTIFNELGYAIGIVVKVIATVISALVTTFIYLGKTIVGVCTTIWSAIEGLYNLIEPVFEKFVSDVTNTFMNVWKIIDGTLKLVIGLIVGAFTGDWSMAWDGIYNIIDGVCGNIKILWDNTIGGIINGLASLADKAKSVFNSLGDASSKYSETVAKAEQSDYAHGTLGHATGTSYFRGGFTHINENNRGELVNLPNGATIIPHDLSKRVMGGQTVNISVNVQGNVIGNESFYNECGQAIYDKLKLSLNNM